MRKSGILYKFVKAGYDNPRKYWYFLPLHINTILCYYVTKATFPPLAFVYDRQPQFSAGGQVQAINNNNNNLLVKNTSKLC